VVGGTLTEDSCILHLQLLYFVLYNAGHTLQVTNMHDQLDAFTFLVACHCCSLSNLLYMQLVYLYTFSHLSLINSHILIQVHITSSV